MSKRMKGGFGSKGTGSKERLPGIVILDRTAGVPIAPRIQAFVYGGEAPLETRTLPYGRWKGVA